MEAEDTAVFLLRLDELAFFRGVLRNQDVLIEHVFTPSGQGNALLGF